MPRGITETEVWNACDALLLEGARPTIERVRQKLGRGSPNTVSPMLETWFKHLGGRIQDPGAFAAPGAVPEPVHQAAQHFWEVAQAQARSEIDARLAEGLAAAAANVEAQKERAGIADAAAFSANAKAAHLQQELEQLRKQLDDERTAHAATAARLDAAQLQRTDLQAELAQSRKAVDEQRERSDQGIAAANERAAGAERRAALEIDRERVIRNKAELAAAAASRRFDEALAELATAGRKLGALESELGHLRSSSQAREQSLMAAAKLQDERFADLAAQLEDARLANSRSTSQHELVQQLVATLTPAIDPKLRHQSKLRSATAKPRKATP